MKGQLQRIPVTVPSELSARLMRIAQKRFATAYRKLPTLGSEALAQFAEQQERELKLKPITPAEVEELTGAESTRLHEEAA